MSNMDDYTIEPLFLRIPRELDVQYERAENIYREVLNSTTEHQLEFLLSSTDIIDVLQTISSHTSEACKTP